MGVIITINNIDRVMQFNTAERKNFLKPSITVKYFLGNLQSGKQFKLQYLITIIDTKHVQHWRKIK